MHQQQQQLQQQSMEGGNSNNNSANNSGHKNNIPVNAPGVVPAQAQNVSPRNGREYWGKMPEPHGQNNGHMQQVGAYFDSLFNFFIFF